MGRDGERTNGTREELMRKLWAETLLLFVTSSKLKHTRVSLQWLAVDKLKLMQEAGPFDGKKNCWIPDEKDGYVPGEIQSTSGDKVTVQNMNTRSVSIHPPTRADLETSRTRAPGPCGNKQVVHHLLIWTFDIPRQLDTGKAASSLVGTSPLHTETSYFAGSNVKSQGRYTCAKRGSSPVQNNC